MSLAMSKLKKREPFDRIAFYGPAASGKTFCAQILTNTVGSNFQRVGFADKLKAIAYDLYGLTSKDGVGRKLLQELADDIKKWDDDVFIKQLLNKVNSMEEGRHPPRIVLDDLRFDSEAKALKKNGFIIIKIECDETVRAERLARLYPSMLEGTMQHRSENQFSLIDKYAMATINSTNEGVIPYLESLLEHKI